MITVNDKIFIAPESVTAPKQMGTVIYIHPKGRFACLQFGEGEGAFRECYPLNMLEERRNLERQQKNA